MTTLEHALALLRAGISAVPIACDGTKRPAVAWKAYQSRLATEEEARRWWGGQRPHGIAAICGEVSGGLELIDFDRLTDETYPAWCRLIEESCPGLLERLIVVRTPRRPVGGMHVWYRFPGIRQGNQKLASDPGAPSDERTLIETRGEGGYALLPGGPDAVHQCGRPYEYLADSLADVPTISADDRDFLLAAARSFDRTEPAYEPTPKSAPGLDLRPGDDFDRRATWEQVLGEHRWKPVMQCGDEVRWARPGKDKGWSATTGHCKGADGADLLRVFSSSADPLQMGKAYGKFRAYAVLNFGGDKGENLSRAASFLRSQGYGSTGFAGGKKKAGQKGGEGGKPAGNEEDAAPASPWVVTLDDGRIDAGTEEELAAARVEADRPRRVRVFDMRTLGCLMNTPYPPPKWLISGIMSEGLNLLVGSPKHGKSILSLNLALTIAGGGEALGVAVDEADVMYLSLEDQHRRVQFRAGMMTAALRKDIVERAKSRLVVCTDWPRLDRGGLELLERTWMKRARNPGLLIIDVWNRFAPSYDSRGSAYRQDADAVSQVKQFCDRHKIAGLLVHHDRKAQGGRIEEDFVASISGTQGIAGSADGIMVLARSRNETVAELKITGRDVEERALELEFDKANLTWKSHGPVLDRVVGKVQEAVLRCLKARGESGAFLKDLVALTKQKEDSIRKALNSLIEEKLIRRIGNAYVYPGAGESEGSGGEGGPFSNFPDPAQLFAS